MNGNSFVDRPQRVTPIVDLPPGISICKVERKSNLTVVSTNKFQPWPRAHISGPIITPVGQHLPSAPRIVFNSSNGMQIKVPPSTSGVSLLRPMTPIITNNSNMVRIQAMTVNSGVQHRSVIVPNTTIKLPVTSIIVPEKKIERSPIKVQPPKPNPIPNQPSAIDSVMDLEISPENSADVISVSSLEDKAPSPHSEPEDVSLTEDKSKENEDESVDESAKDTIMFEHDINGGKELGGNPNEMISLQINKGVLSNPYGPIMLLDKSSESLKSVEIETVSDSPEKLRRSKSLNDSISPENPAKRAPKRRHSSDCLKDNELGTKKVKSGPKGLLCDEIISENFSDSDTSLSNLDESQTKVNIKEELIDDEMDLTNVLEQNLEEGIKQNGIIKAEAPDETFELTEEETNIDNEVFEMKFHDRVKLLKDCVFSEKNKPNPMDLIFWEDDSKTGYLPGSSISLTTNDLGLLDLMDDAETDAEKDLKFNSKKMNILYRRLLNNKIFEKRAKSENVAIQTKCRNCHYIGNVEEFPEVDICSQACSTILAASNKEPDDVRANEEQFWIKYMKSTCSYAAPRHFFQNRTVLNNKFRLGMKVEVIDPTNEGDITIGTVRESASGRVKILLEHGKISFLAYYWTNSWQIFPIGFSESKKMPLKLSQHILETTNYMKQLKESKNSYKDWKAMKRILAEPSRFKVGWKLEAFDVKNSGQLQVATIGAVIGKHVLVCFDDQPNPFKNYWCNDTSPLIRPMNYHQGEGLELISPRENFNWSNYLEETKSWAAPENAFRTRQPVPFQVGMKLEAVDCYNSLVVRPATVTKVKPYELEITYDSFENSPGHSVWVMDDSEDIFPIRWCFLNKHKLFLNYTEKKSAFTSWQYTMQPKLITNKIVPAPQPFSPSMDNGNETIKHLTDLVENQSKLYTLKNIIKDYGPSMKYNINLWKENSRSIVVSSNRKPNSVNPMEWSAVDVKNYINAIPKCQYIGDYFQQQDINGESLLSISFEDLVQTLDLKIGPAIKIYNTIVALRDDWNKLFYGI